MSIIATLSDRLAACNFCHEKTLFYHSTTLKGLCQSGVLLFDDFDATLLLPERTLLAGYAECYDACLVGYPLSVVRRLCKRRESLKHHGQRTTDH